MGISFPDTNLSIFASSAFLKLVVFPCSLLFASDSESQSDGQTNADVHDEEWLFVRVPFACVSSGRFVSIEFFVLPLSLPYPIRPCEVVAHSFFPRPFTPRFVRRKSVYPHHTSDSLSLTPSLTPTASLSLSLPPDTISSHFLTCHIQTGALHNNHPSDK